MNSSTSNQQTTGTAYQHAIVIGGSIAGLTTARVLSDHFAQVTVIERDSPSVATAFRKGAPHARHPHALLARGEQSLEALFPGFRQELLAAGALTANFGTEWDFFVNGAWVQPFHSALTSTICSRPLLESTLYQRLTRVPNVRFSHEQEVLGLLTDDKRKRATGVKVRERHNLDAPMVALTADLVIDASGRDSHTPAWLAELGYTPPQETTINAFVGYSTRIYRQPVTFNEPWKLMYIMPMYPHTARGAVIIPLEADEQGPRWHALLIGVGGDYPPTDEAGFLDFARSLRSPRFYEAIKDAEPLTAPYGYRRAENRMRYYEKLPRYLENFLVTGDAVYAFNPVYGQGMSTAAMTSQMLDNCLKEQRRRAGAPTLTGLAQRFQKELAGLIAGPWQMATGQDIRWPKTEGGQAPDPVTRLVQRYLDQVLNTMPNNAIVAEAFYHVQNMLKPPTSLFQPRILWQVLKPQVQPVPAISARNLVHAG